MLLMVTGKGQLHGHRTEAKWHEKRVNQALIFHDTSTSTAIQLWESIQPQFKHLPCLMLHLHAWCFVETIHPGRVVKSL